MAPEVPIDWRVEPLSRLGAFHKGRGGPKRDNQDTGVPVVRYGELYTEHHEVIRDLYTFVSPERAEDYTPLRSGDLLFAGAGETADEIGKSAVFLGPEIAYTSGDTVIFRPDGEVDPLFLGYASNGRAARAHKRSVGQGSSILHIYARDLETLELPVPPLPEQRRIAAILSSVDDAIAATRKVIEQTKRVKQGLLQTLMTRGIGHTRFKKSEVGEIPEGWDVVRIKDAGNIITGSTPPTSDESYWGGSLPFVTPGEIQEDTPVLEATERNLTIMGANKGRRVPAGSVLVVCIGSSIGKVGLSTQDVCFNQQINAIVPRAGDEWFLYGACSRLMPLMRQVTGRQAVPIVNKTAFSTLLIPWPSANERSKIGRILEQVETSVGADMATASQLALLKRGLMQSLLTGRVRVQPD